LRSNQVRLNIDVSQAIDQTKPKYPYIGKSIPHSSTYIQPHKKITIFEAILQKLRLDILGNYEQHSHKEKKILIIRFSKYNILIKETKIAKKN